MLTVHDSKGRTYRLTEQIGRGGEGTVFACPDDYTVVAKIYHASVDEEKAAKLRWMADHQSEPLLKVAAWIVDTLHDEAGRTVGFLMPNVKAKEIHELYSLKSRRVYFPDATWTFLVHTAANVARAFYVLHKNEHIMGDVNHGNCVVLADGTVKLIDCDSYSISRDGRRDRCEVGVATHLAPELQGKDLSAIEREPAHDNFGLAVIVFQLLFLGRHPFAGRYLGDEEKELEDCIRERRFAYSADAHSRQVKQPPGTLALEKVGPRLAALFERAFLTEDRPEPREWIEALEDLSASLKQCSMHIGHYYFQELAACPWCELEGQTGLMLFPFVSHNASEKGENFNIFTVENLLASLVVPANLPAKPIKNALAAVVKPSPEALDMRRRHRRQWIVYSAGQFVFMLTVMTIFGAGAAFFLGIILMIAFLVISGDAGRNFKSDLDERAGRANADWALLENEWATIDAHGFGQEFARIRQRIGDYQGLQKQSLQQRKLLMDKSLQYELSLHLASFPVAEAAIPGVERSRLELLEDFGIRTAADVDAKRFKSLPPPVRELAGRLVAWREEIERRFDVEDRTEVPPPVLERFETDFALQRRKIEREIETMLGTLRARSTHLRQRQHHLQEKSAKLAEVLRQSETDAATMGSLAPLATSLILITTLLPIFGVALQTPGVKEKPPYLAPLSSAPSVTTAPLSNSAIAINKKPPQTMRSRDVLPTSLTDREIKAMTDEERIDTADRLIDRVVSDLARETDASALLDYERIEQHARLAVRLAPDYAAAHAELGHFNLKQKRLAEALRNFQKALSLDPDDERAKLGLGIHAVETKNYRKAVELLPAYTDYNARSYEGNFHLGRAYKGLKEYGTALGYYAVAMTLKTPNAQVRYEYGFCLAKQGNSELAREQYQELLDLDEDLAEKLRREAGLKIEVVDPPKQDLSIRKAPKPGSYYELK